MMKLYACLGSGNCMKPWLALNQLEREFEVVLIDVLKGEQKSPQFLQINPFGVVPFLCVDGQQADGAGAPTGIGESNAMLWYLAEGSALMPESAAERAEALQWMFFEQSKLEPFISPARFFTHILPDENGEKAADIAQWRERAKFGLERLNTHLKGRQFMLASGYSVADIAVFGYVHVLEQAGLRGADYPDIMRWIGDVSQTEGFRSLDELGVQTGMAA